MSHAPILAQQLSMVNHAIPACIAETSNSIIESRIQNNFNLINVISGILLGTLFQHFGRTLDDTDITSGDIANTVGFSLVRLSFTIGRANSIKEEFLSCDFGKNPQSLLNLAGDHLASTCGSDMFKSYKANSLKLWLKDSLGCLSDGSSVQKGKLNALSGLYMDLELLNQTNDS